MEYTHHFQQIEKAINFINTRRSLQPSLEEVAAHVHMSKYHFQRVFKKWAGISPKEFLQYLTLEQAKIALQKGKSTLEAAYEAGLSGNGRLHDLFVKIEACTPGEYSKGGRDLEFRISKIDSPFGEAIVLESTRGISRLSFDSKSNLLTELRTQFPHAKITEGLGPNGLKVQQYFSAWQYPDGKISLDLWGTPFQIQVWKALLQVPSSNLISYKDVAEIIGKPHSPRAVGTAIGKNPVAYLIPCHRVIRNTGEMGNYKWGEDRKLAINGYESAVLAD